MEAGRTAYRPLIAVHLVWHVASEEAAAQAEAVFANLFEDPRDRSTHGLRIPVRHWRLDNDAARVRPLPYDLAVGDAERSLVVLLVDAALRAAIGVDDVLRDLWQRTPAPHLFM